MAKMATYCYKLRFHFLFLEIQIKEVYMSPECLSCYPTLPSAIPCRLLTYHIMFITIVIITNRGVVVNTCKEFDTLPLSKGHFNYACIITM